MNEKKLDKRELNLDEMDQVSGGKLISDKQNLINRPIDPEGLKQKLREKKTGIVDRIRPEIRNP